MLLLTLASGAVAFVVSASPCAAQQRPCMDDLKKFCPDAKPGTPDALKCLQSHEGQLSDACKTRMERGKARMEKGSKTREACKGDVEKLCKDAPRGGGKVRECLQQHQADLSADCKTALAAKAGKQKAQQPGGANTKSN
jgi:hypothetical protein